MALTNTFVGFEAGCNASQDPDAENSTAIGAFSFTTASNQFVLGNDQIEDIRAFGVSMLKARPADFNYFFGPAGNLTLTGGANVGVGSGAMAALTSGSNNTAIGHQALQALEASSGNVAIGDLAMSESVSAIDCTAIGSEAMRHNVSGVGNTAVGRLALSENAAGGNNTAVGANALRLNTDGEQNVALGFRAAEANLTGSLNIFIGQEAALLREVGDENVVIGHSAMAGTSTAASKNVAVGYLALNNYGGDNATAVGHSALAQATGADNTAVGAGAGGSVTTGSSNVFLGLNAGSNASQSASAQNSIAIGANAFTTASNQVVLGDANITQTVLRGNVGIGTTSPEGVLHAVSDGSNLPFIEAAGLTTDAAHWVARFLSTKTSAPGDAFGASIVFQIRQAGQPRNTLGIIGAERAGADNTGEIHIRPSVAGTLADGLAVRGSKTILGWSSGIPSGGSSGLGYAFSTTPNFGIFFGSGAPTLAAAKGSLYLRSDGSGTNNRAYINTDGSTGWTALTTAS